MSLVTVLVGGEDSVKQISLYFTGHGDVQHILLEPVRMAVPALQGAPKELEKEREGLAMAVSTQSVLSTLTLVLPLFVFVFPCVFVSEEPLQLLVSMQC